MSNTEAQEISGSVQFLILFHSDRCRVLSFLSIMFVVSFRFVSKPNNTHVSQIEKRIAGNCFAFFHNSLSLHSLGQQLDSHQAHVKSWLRSSSANHSPAFHNDAWWVFDDWLFVHCGFNTGSVPSALHVSCVQFSNTALHPFLVCTRSVTHHLWYATTVIM